MMQHNEADNGYSIYIIVWLALVVLTGITVTVAGVDFKGLHQLLGYNPAVGLAIIIACVKSTLVVLFFMHIKHEPVLFKVLISVCLITFIIFISLTFFDTAFR